MTKPLRIVLVGHGRVPIPPQGWGAVESLIWQYYLTLQKQGHNPSILNRKWRTASLIVALMVRFGKIDVVHVHQERALRWMKPLVGSRALLVVTGHAAIEADGKPSDETYLHDILIGDYHLVHHRELGELVKAQKPSAHVAVLRNGTEVQEFKVADSGNGKAVCVGKLHVRKRQRELAQVLTQAGVPVDFIGPTGDDDLDLEHQHLKIGEWSRERIRAELTQYSALVLVSAAEGQPLVVAEGLAAGLCVVVSRESAQNLDTSQPFVFLVDGPEDWAEATRKAIEANASLRQQARAYAERQFSYEGILTDYVHQMRAWLSEKA